MYLVAVAELRGPLEREAAELARDLGSTPYEARLAVSGALPSIVLTTSDRARAEELAAKLRARGQGAVLADTDEVVAHDRMVSMRRFALDAEGLRSPDDAAALPFVDVLCLLRAMHRTTTNTIAETTERKINVPAAVISGGLIATKVVRKESTVAVEQREQVLYVFRRSGATPWILPASTSQYVALGADLASTTHENFATTIRLLRAAAPGAFYDERLLRPPRNANGAHAGNDVDLAAHLLAAWFATLDRERPPYRHA